MSKEQLKHIVGDKYSPIGNFAHSHSQRRRGLAGIELDESPDEMIFEHCRSIHTFGMKFNLRVLFLDKHKTIIKIVEVGKNRIVFAPRHTHAIVEIPLR